MKTETSRNHVNILQDKENNTNSRIKLKELQSSALDKENLVGRQRIGKTNNKLNYENEKLEKRTKVEDKGIQTGKAVITAEDLTSEEPSIDYWKCLAETRGNALNDSLQELDRLREQNDLLEETTKNLQEENKACKEMLDESRHLVEVLQEILGEGEEEEENKEQ